ncbi:MAG: sensor histidine kinase, partial [Firmicutes bacterium]|nr:sensor histidine kinase [Bacillota bacterium]
DSIRVAVADRGPGVDPELLPRLFERFVTGDRSRQGGGNGLGLAIVAEVARRFGGRVEVLNRDPEQGTVFSLVLPLPPEPVAVGEPCRPPQPAAGG